jgi:hypothetical protein
LGQILAKQLDPRYRRTALDVLKRLDDQERAAARADREAYQTAVAQMAALDTMEGGRTKRIRSTSTKRPAKEQPPVDLDHLINEIAQIAEQRRSREFEPPLVSVGVRPDDPPEVARGATQLLEVATESQGVVSQDRQPPIVDPEQTDAPLPVGCTKESSESSDMAVLEPLTGENAAEPELLVDGSSEPASEVEFDLVSIPGWFPPRFRRVQRRG